MKTKLTRKQINYIDHLHRLIKEYGYASFEFKTYSEYSKLNSKQAGVYIRKLEREMTPAFYEALEEEANLEEIYGLGQD